MTITQNLKSKSDIQLFPNVALHTSILQILSLNTVHNIIIQLINN